MAATDPTPAGAYTSASPTGGGYKPTRPHPAGATNRRARTGGVSPISVVARRRAKLTLAMPDQTHHGDQVVQLTVPAHEAEMATDRLWTAGATAVSVADHDGKVTLVASYPTDAAAAQVAGEIAGAELLVVDPSWRDEWKRYAEPVAIGHRLIVAPGWRDVDLAAGRLIIRIDPGTAFGSGSHASTRMMLTELDQRPPAGLDVLDLGCGSGILAVAAAVLGARRVIAVDIDPDSLRCTRANAHANGVADKIAVCMGLDDVEPASLDVALVNVTASVHAEVGPAATAAVRPGGIILVAGLLPGQWRHVAGAYAGTAVADVVELDGWEGLRLVAVGIAARSR